MKKKTKINLIVISSTILLGVLIPFATSYLGDFKQNHINSKLPPNSENIEFDGIKSNLANYGFNLSDQADNNFSNLDTKYSSNNDYGLESYYVNSDNFTFDTTNTSIISDSIYHNDEKIYEEVYYPNNMLVDTKFIGENPIEYIYDDSDNLTNIIINDSTLGFKYNNDNLLSQEYLGEDLEKEFFYDTNGRLINEKDYVKNNSLTYNYDQNDNLIDDRYHDFSIDYFNKAITLDFNGNKTIYMFDYEYAGKNYVSSIEYNNGFKLKLSYLNDKVTSVKNNNYQLSYILNSNLDYVGFIYNDDTYYYLNDAACNTYSLIDEEGIPYTFYNINAFGEVSVLEKNSVDLSRINNVVLNGYFFDPYNKVYLGGDELYAPSLNCKYDIRNAKQNKLNISDLKNQPQRESYARVDLPALKSIEGMVIKDVITNLNKTKKIDAVSDVLFSDRTDKVSGSVDIFTLPYGIYSNNIKNIFNGSEVYEIAYNDKDKHYINKARHKLEKANKVIYFEDEIKDANPCSRGKLEFSGQFIYLGYYIEYMSDGSGLIVFNVKDKNELNYKTFLNLYDYDLNQYVNFVQNTFDVNVDFKDAVKIIPGLNRESYDVIVNYMNYIESFRGQIEQKQTEYIDENFIDSSEIVHLGDTMDIYEKQDLDDKMLILSKTGGVTVKALPFYQVKKNRVKFLATVAGLVAVSVVTVVCVATPGLNVIVPIFTAALVKGYAAFKACATMCLLLSTVKYIKNTITGQNEINFIDALNEGITNFCNTSLSMVYSQMIFGAITADLRMVKDAFVINKNNFYLKKYNKIMEPTFMWDDSGAVDWYYSQTAKYTAKGLYGEVKIERLLNNFYTSRQSEFYLKICKKYSRKKFFKELGDLYEK